MVRVAKQAWELSTKQLDMIKMQKKELEDKSARYIVEDSTNDYPAFCELLMTLCWLMQ